METSHQESFPGGHSPRISFILKLFELEVRLSFVGQGPLLIASSSFSPISFCLLKMIIHIASALYLRDDIHMLDPVVPRPHSVSQSGISEETKGQRSGDHTKFT